MMYAQNVLKEYYTAELCGSSSSAVFQNYKLNFATENCYLYLFQGL